MEKKEESFGSKLLFFGSTAKISSRSLKANSISLGGVEAYVNRYRNMNIFESK